MNIRQLFIKQNFSSRKGTPIQYIVVHDTGNPRQGANAYMHYKYFNTTDRQASAHYFVDSKEIVQIVRDEHASWHCGDGKGRYGITNGNSIGIEICINSDSNYDIAVEKTVELVKELMRKYNIPLDRVVRHYDASRKTCPLTMSKNNWEKWHEFKAKVGQRPDTVKVRINGKLHFIDGRMIDNKNYVGIREFADALGHSVSWDSRKREVVIK